MHSLWYLVSQLSTHLWNIWNVYWIKLLLIRIDTFGHRIEKSILVSLGSIAPIILYYFTWFFWVLCCRVLQYTVSEMKLYLHLKTSYSIDSLNGDMFVLFARPKSSWQFRSRKLHWFVTSCWRELSSSDGFDYE